MVSSRFVSTKAMKKKSLEKVVRRLNKGQKIDNVHVITLPNHNRYWLAIMSVPCYYQHQALGRDDLVVGIAADYSDALVCVGFIMQNLLDDNQDISKNSLERAFDYAMVP